MQFSSRTLLIIPEIYEYIELSGCLKGILFYGGTGHTVK